MISKHYTYAYSLPSSYIILKHYTHAYTTYALPRKEQPNTAVRACKQNVSMYACKKSVYEVLYLCTYDIYDAVPASYVLYVHKYDAMYYMYTSMTQSQI